MYLKVKVVTDTRRDEIEKISDDRFKISVRASAKRNLANTRVRELVADYLKIPLAKTRIVRGHHSSNKILSVSN